MQRVRVATQSVFAIVPVIFRSRRKFWLSCDLADSPYNVMRSAMVGNGGRRLAVVYVFFHSVVPQVSFSSISLMVF